MRCVPDRGASKYLVFPSRTQSAGEKGDRRVLLRALLFGESVDGDQAGLCGMRSLLRPVGVRAEFGGRIYGDGGIMGAGEAFRPSELLHVQLAALEG